jgi:basic amino acid/polyamine antiporter, APA family
MAPIYTDVRRSIGFWSGTALLVGTVIGAGIFRTPASIASVLSDPRIILGMWVFFGLVSLCGALTLAELSTMLPKTGGVYVYLRAAYGDAAAFVFGWLYMLAAIPAGMAALAVFFSELMLGFAGIPLATASWGLPLVASTLVVVLSWANIAGVRLGTSIQNIFALLKVGALLALIAIVFGFGQGDTGRWWAAPAQPATMVDVATIVRSVMFSFNGWVYISLVAGELEQPERRLGRIIFIGTGAVVVIYVLANLAYLYLIPLAAMPGTVVAREAMRIVVGPIGSALMGAAIVTSVCGAMNGVIFTKSRVAYALARDGLSFSVLGRAHPTRATPYVSIAIQGVVAVILILALRDPLNPSRLFDRITQYFILVEWLALLFAIAAVFVLRRTMPDAPRPYRTPGYPFVPIFFLVGTALGLGAILWSSCSRGDYSPLAGLGIVAAGFPVYHLWRRRAMTVSEPVSVVK